MKKKHIQEGPTLFDGLDEKWEMPYNNEGFTPKTIEPLLSVKTYPFTIMEASKGKKNSDVFESMKFNDKRIKIIIKLEAVAKSLRDQAEKINTSVNGNWTHRRQSFANNAMHKKERLLKDANVFETLAVLWNANQCPVILQEIRSASDLDVYYPTPPTSENGKWYHEEYPKHLKKATRLGLKSKEDGDMFKQHIKELQVIELSHEEKKRQEIDKAIAAIRGADISGFFPTPNDVIDTMLEYACIEDGMTILEPSAGIGSIADRIVEKGYKVDIACVEVHHSLSNIIALKGYNVIHDDILDIKGQTCTYDKVIMNPPFEKGQDIEHVKHCYDTFLKEGGTLVSIMSAGVMNNSTKKYIEFREWVEKEAGVFIELGQAFKDSFRNTNVSVVILMIEK